VKDMCYEVRRAEACVAPFPPPNMVLHGLDSSTSHTPMQRHACPVFVLVLMSTTWGTGEPQGSTGEAEESSIHPQDLRVLITFSTLFCVSGTCTAQVTVSGLLPRGQYTMGIEQQALLLGGPTIIFQEFRTICGALDSSCSLPHNSRGTSTSPSAR
jgi:hypothetical protein